MTSSKKVSTSDCNSERQTEIATQPQKLEIFISLYLWHLALKFKIQIQGFWSWPSW